MFYCYVQEQYEKARRLMEGKIEEVEIKLKNVRLVLQEKVNQLKEQVNPRLSQVLHMSSA